MSASEPPFLGRQREIDVLEQRTRAPGITIVRGRPQIGKSRLLTEFKTIARRQGRMVGMAAATEAFGDTMRRAVADAYDHWLRQAGAVEQLRQIISQQNHNLPTRVGKVFGRLLSKAGDELSSALPGAGTVGAIIEETFSCLASINDDLRAGGTRPGPIESDEVKAFLRPMAETGGTPVILILNQWEEGLELASDAATLRAFAAPGADWPPLHIIVHLRDPRHAGDQGAQPPSDAGTVLRNLVRASRAQYLDLGPIAFSGIEHLKDRDDLMRYLREHVPGAIEIGQEDDIIGVINGNPGVLERWHKASETDRGDAEALIEWAAHAHDYHYPEVTQALDALLAKANESDRDRHALLVALRVALLPGTLPGPMWTACERAILNGASNTVLADLCASGLLERKADGAYCFGHSTRIVTGLRWATDTNKDGGATQPRARAHTEQAFDELVLALIGDDRNTFDPEPDWTTRVRVNLVQVLNQLCPALTTSVRVRRLCAAATALFNLPFCENNLSTAWTDEEAVQVGESRLLAQALFLASARCLATGCHKPPLYERLVELAQSHRGDPVVQYNYIGFLVNMIPQIKDPGYHAERFIHELKSAAAPFSHDDRFSVLVAQGLSNGIASTTSVPNSTCVCIDSQCAAPSQAADTLVNLCSSCCDASCASSTGNDLLIQAKSLLRELVDLAESKPEVGQLCSARMRGSVLLFEFTVKLRHVPEVLHHVETLVPLREALLAQADIVPLARKVFADALEVAREKNDADAHARLLAASRAIFGEEAG